jgi:hypothetical protein
MPSLKGKKAADALKIAGGALFLGASIALLVHRMPHHTYIAVHADKPRPPRGEEPAPAPAAPVPSAPAAAPHAAPKPFPRAPEHAAPAALEAAPASAPRSTAAERHEDLMNSCVPEISLLCYKIPEKGLARCLEGYDDALLGPCRRALHGLRAPRAPADEDEEEPAP